MQTGHFRKAKDRGSPKKNKQRKPPQLCFICGLGDNLSRQASVLYHSWCAYSSGYTLKEMQILDQLLGYRTIKNN